MSSAPRIEIDVPRFWENPYPALARMRKEAPIVFVPQLASTLLCRRDDIFLCEKQIDVFSSDQPEGLMTKLMGLNFMRKDGEAHLSERNSIFPSVSPKTVKTHWAERFRLHATQILDELAPAKEADFVRDFSMPFSAECLKSLTGLTNIRFQEMNDWSQAMIDGIANYTGDAAVEARCHAATQSIDAAIEARIHDLRRQPDLSLLSVMLESGMPMPSIQANIKLVISGGQNEPRDAIAGTIWALLTHPDQLREAMDGVVPWIQAFEEYARWISPIGMSPRRVAKPWTIRDVDFETNDRVFLMFGSANRDERQFERADQYDIRRDVSKSIAFGAGPHFCAGAWASRAMIADVALPSVFGRLKGLSIQRDASIRMVGWAFRGLLSLPVAWE